MPSSQPSSLRYRPAVLVLTGAAAAYAAYLVYQSIQASPSDGLHRSNAVRRRSRRRESAAARTAALAAALSAQQASSPAQADGEDTSTPSHANVPVRVNDALREITMQAHPASGHDQVTNEIIGIHDAFFDRFFRREFRDRAPSADEVEAIRHVLGERNPDPTAIDRAVARHAEGLAQDGATVPDGAESIAGTDLSWGSEDDVDEALDQDGQTLQRALYHIAEERARQDGVLHRGITCNGCDEKPIRGVRWHCANCVDYDLCSNCEATNSHHKTHVLYKIRIPTPHLNLQRQDVLYPGKPHKMRPSVDSALKKRLVSETKMEAEEIEALWDQFTCLAGTKWREDPNNVGYALDRRAFNHAFVPRYNSFTAAPNLIYDRVFAYYDTDRNGLIGFEEWIKGVAGMHTTDVEVKARIVFNGYDIDGDGYVSRRDLLRIFRAFYAIEKEATQNYVAALTEGYSPRKNMKMIASSQPLGSAFSPHEIVPLSVDPIRFLKSYHDDTNTTPVLRDGDSDLARREDMLSATRESVLLANDVPHGHLLENEVPRTVADRWVRRQFYIDEEEGLRPPQDLVDEIEAQDQEVGPNGQSRDSQSPSESVQERWGGYDVPQPEKDMGKEVLYQLTQEGFNELLDPMFQEKEDLAMDAHETRSLRRKKAHAIEEVLNLFDIYKEDAEAIAQIGFFRYMKGVVEFFCSEFDEANRSGTLQEAALSGENAGYDRERLKELMYRQYANNEAILHSVLKSHIVKGSGYKEPDSMTLFNVILCMIQLREEVLHATFLCVEGLGWFGPNDGNKTPAAVDDQTLPQFRPNSSTDTYTTWSSHGQALDGEEGSRSTRGPSIHGYRVPISGYQTPFERYSETRGDYLVSASEGPFFVYTDIGDIITTPPDDAPASSPTNYSEATAQPPATTPNQGPTELSPQEFENAAPEVRADALAQRSTQYWRAFTNDPEMYRFSITSTGPNTASLSFHVKPVSHSVYTSYNPSLDPLKPVLRRIRHRAMDPNSRLHTTMLASLQLVEDEISERKGSGLIGYEEFAGFMREGKLRFLESWMEWVSI
ncbi:hypothetical protein NX059_005805 [Plenodomus lindquistii]|nr:hypothetical protein NX059_005805 [Plenodomus lindquistii]